MGLLHILATLICGAPAALGAAQGLRGSEVREGVRILITSNASTPSDPEPPPVSAATISGLPSIKWGDLEPRDGEMPACAVQRQWQESGLFCTASAAYLAFVRVFPPDPSSGTKKQAPLNPTGALPSKLEDLRPLPPGVDATIVAAEKPTYYWLYRVIINFYSQLKRLRRTDDVDLAVGDGWTNRRYYRVDAEKGPFAATYTNGSNMLVILRGTQYAVEWEKDFEYGWADQDGANRTFPGNVHSGFYSIYTQLGEPIREEVARQRPARITVAGHSLGGSVAALLGYSLAARYPNVPIDLVTFGTPAVGDAKFMASFNSKVNSRHVTFTGPGKEGKSYLVGDFISQLPCTNTTSCPLLGTLGSNAEPDQFFDYAPFGAIVPFDYSQLPNSDTWRYKSDIFSILFAPIANHDCSYLCWTAQAVDDPNDMCSFSLFGSLFGADETICSTLM